MKVLHIVYTVDYSYPVNSNTTESVVANILHLVQLFLVKFIPSLAYCSQTPVPD